MHFSTRLKWARFILFLAAAYNIGWGIAVSLFPKLILFDDHSSRFMLIILQCVGMLVGVYGIAYYIASKDPAKYWPLVLVGYIGKILGPIGAFYYVYLGEIKKEFLIVNVFNDLIWLIPFTWLLYQAIKGKLSPPPANDRSLYQLAAGSDFARLSPSVQAFHNVRTPTTFKGVFKVERGNTSMGRLLGNLSGLPEASNAAEVVLTVIPFPSGEYWNRVIGGRKFETKQWLEGDYIIESFKGMNISLLVRAENGSLIMKDASSTIFGIPLPPFFTPSVDAFAKEAGEGVAVSIEVRFRPFGRIIKYSGIIQPAQTPSLG
jgi:hypothetical protein